MKAELPLGLRAEKARLPETNPLPELPEVETVRRVLSERLSGKTLLSYKVGSPTFYRKPDESTLKKLIGARLQTLQRRGKYLLFDFSNGEKLNLHLGMSGRLNLTGETSHLRLQLVFSGEILNFQDSRRFGQAGCPLPQLGPEPLGINFNADHLRHIFRQKNASVKSLIMNQALIAGLGNIYATEALFNAKIRPQRSAKSLSGKETEALYRAITEVLALAIECGGSTLQDASYLNPLGQKGQFQKHLGVYGKKRCQKGHETLRTRKIIAGRKAYYCPDCQK